MKDPKLERCKQVIRQYEENQKKQKIELSKKPKVRPTKISIPKKTTQKDIVKDIKKMDYKGVEDIKDKVAEEIELDKEINLDEILTDEDTDEEEKPIRSSISQNIKEKINQETPKKDFVPRKSTKKKNYGESFKKLQNQPRVENEPIVFEKPKEDFKKKDLDILNLIKRRKKEIKKEIEDEEEKGIFRPKPFRD